ncbi:hypothetical protein QP164_11960 [Sphingomonas sp. LR59]|uniref:hypothetical protein n=1 Tax=Sphingomonas sp. LR59 TaxID=3050232 RepID=UPI002FE36595
MTRAEWLTARMLAADARDSVPHEMLAFWQGAGWDAAQIDHATAKGWAGFRKIITPLPLSYTRIEDGDTLTIGARDWRVVTGSGHSPNTRACTMKPAAYSSPATRSSPGSAPTSRSASPNRTPTR